MTQPSASLIDLRGASVILTRPAGTAAALARRVKSRGGRPVLLPGMTLRARAPAEPLQRGVQADWIVFTSPAAVRFAWKLEPGLRFPPRARFAAVGKGTAAALARRGCEDVVIPQATQDSAGLLAQTALQRIRGERVAVIGAPGGRDLLVPTLRQRGAHVTRIDVYERTTPRWTRRHFDALAKASRPWILLVSSGEALAQIASALPEALATAIRRADCVVSSARLAALAEQQGFLHVHVARSALSEDLLDGAAAALAHHRL